MRSDGVMQIRLEPRDEYMHPLESASNFNESMYFNVYDPAERVGGFLRLGNRANEGYAELTTCLYLPDGRVAFMFNRPKIANNDAFDAGGTRFEVVTPFEELRTTYDGKVALLAEPLQMANTGYDDLQQVDLAKGYATAQGDIALQPLNGLFAEGRLYSTVEDLYRWDQALYTDKLLPQPALRAMFTAQVPVPDGKYYGGQGWSYGYGWFIAPDKPHYVLHGGMYPGYRTEFRRYLDDDVTIILLCNQEAVALHLTAEAIAEKLFETGKQ